MEGTGKWVRIRIRLLALCFLLVFSLITVRAFRLQVLGQDEWRQRAERQHQKVIPLTPQRGTIFDRNGEELAVSVEVDSIYAEPDKVDEPRKASRLLADALDLPGTGVAAKLKSKKGFLWLKRQVTPRETERVRRLDLPGIRFVKEHRRFYPNSEIGAQVVGFTGLDPKGLEGLELEYDPVLLGQGGYLVTERDALGRGMGSGDPAIREGSRGNDLYLTLDKNLQYIAEKELAAGVRAAGARAGSVIVLDPQTGQVLAMANQPDYNPNAFGRFRPSDWRNRGLCDTYEPGSTFKIFLLAAALKEGVVAPGQTIDCERGAYAVGGKVIHDHHPYEELSLAEIIKFSSNIGVAKIGKALERERLYSNLRAFGFGSPTDLDLPGEVGGLLREPSRWFEIDLAAISFGQGLTVTPLQLTVATAAIANGGNLMAPYLVEKVVDSYGGLVEKRSPRVVRRVLSSSVARQVRDMMVLATEEGGTGTLAAVPGFRVAGKTGTAQKVDPVTGGYSADKRIGSFVGFVPAEDPRLVINVVIDEPQGDTYGGLVAAPVFSRIADQALRYLKVPPTTPVESMESPRIVAEVLAIPPAGSIPAHDAAAQSAPRMPDCVGMSSRQVLEVMERTGLNIRLKGSGRVLEQSPPAGNPIDYRNEVWVKLAPPS